MPAPRSQSSRTTSRWPANAACEPRAHRSELASTARLGERTLLFERKTSLGLERPEIPVAGRDLAAERARFVAEAIAVQPAQIVDQARDDRV
jgi:hypothetical protein